MGFFGNRTPPQPSRGAWEVPEPGARQGADAGGVRMIRPPQPMDRKEAGLSSRMIESLILKTLKQEGGQTEQELSTLLCLAPGCFRTELQSLYTRQCLDSPAPLKFDLTAKGRDLTSYYEGEDAYIGPAPVSFKGYCEMVRLQATKGRRIPQDEFDQSFAHMAAPAETRRLLREAFNSRQVILLWGPPGNGKSLWSDSLHRLLKDPVLLPYAFEFNNKVIQYFDPAYHEALGDLMAQEEAAFTNTVAVNQKPDRRWVISRPPLVTVGTEFRIEHFEIAFDGKYNAPAHLKSNNGIFIFDDLGRQAQDHNMILNQFIYPLEHQETIIKFVGGSAIRAPYRQRLFLSTNLNFRQIIDDAFARRLLYQVLIDRPTDEDWGRILVNMARSYGIVDTDFLAEMARKTLYWYKRDGRVIRAADPRNLFRMADATLDEGEVLRRKLDMTLWERIYEQYPVAYEKDATGYSVDEADDDQVRWQFEELAARHAVDSKVAAALLEAMLSHFRDQGRYQRPSDVGNLFTMADGARPAELTVAEYLTAETWRRILDEYPNFTPSDAERMRGSLGLGGK